MLDVKTVGSDLTPAQQDEILIDLSYFLDQFGSTRAVRTKLQEQEGAIKRLRRQAQHFVNRRTDKDGEEEHSNNQDNPPHCCEVAMDVVDETMTNLDFFLRTIGSTRAVRAKLASQRQEIADLERTV
ncbi:hypothetical protein PI124_g11359 [Phytophthora idaei]|nr:hypothetical protein PI125_g10778 [Phytophthora idaei]KAG3153428.1 hypothetical protein PI126_g10091 [Phytophthora idaei]KAG3243837.1 hypothetical protein PI124_g11359 [Phytophthora idaei]